MIPARRQAYRQLLEKFAASGIGCCESGALLANHNSWQIGGPADLLVEPSNAIQIAKVIRFANVNNIPLVVIGQGSNLLFDDAGLHGIVLKLGPRFSNIDITGRRIVAEGGAWVPGLARRAMLAGLAGLEHTIGIPGTIGGLVMMNGGSQRKGIGDNVRLVHVVTRSGEIRELTQAECDFGYRSSALQGTGSVVVKVELECERSDPTVIRRMMLADLRERRRKFPRKEPNCGSVFLSTSEMHASVGPPGKIIEDAGLKGACIGNAEVSRQHANFIVNRGGATSANVLDLIAHIRQVVQSKIGFELCCEVRYVSPEGKILPAHQAVS